MRKLILQVLILIWVSKGYAHKVNVFAWIEGNKVFCEAYYTDGSKVKIGKIEVFKKNGTKLLEGKTNEEGIFSFKVPEKTNLKIVLHAGIGHRAEIEIPAGNLPEVKKVKENKRGESTHKKDKEGVYSVSTEEIKKIVEEVLDEKLHPLYKMLTEQRKYEGVKFSEVVGGIGYIFGILGIILFLMRRKK